MSLCDTLPDSRSREGILCHLPRSLSLQGVALQGLSVCFLGHAVCVVCSRTGIISSEMGEELLHSLSAAIGSIHSGSFFTELQLARPKKREIWRKSGKREILEEVIWEFFILVS